MNRTGLKIDNVSFSYNRDNSVLDTLSFKADYGEVVSIIGSNGAGKSTLFKCILGIIKSYSGDIYLDGINIRNLEARKLAKQISYIPQAHYSAFNYSVMDMVLMGTSNQISSIGNPGHRQEEQAIAALEKIGIRHLQNKSFSAISGGEQQMVLMARSIVQNAKVWILDEPTSSLDYGNQIRILKQLKELAGSGYLILQSIHNPDQAMEFSNKIIAIKDGRVIKQGDPKKTLNEETIKKIYGNEIEWKYKK